MTERLLKARRGYDIKKVDLREKEFKELKEKVDNTTDKIKKNPKKEKDGFNIDIIENDTKDSLINGFMDTPKNKRKQYIKKNRRAFKNLLPTEQKEIFRIFYEYL